MNKKMEKKRRRIAHKSKAPLVLLKPNASHRHRCAFGNKSHPIAMFSPPMELKECVLFLEGGCSVCICVCERETLLSECFKLG